MGMSSRANNGRAGRPVVAVRADGSGERRFPTAAAAARESGAEYGEVLMALRLGTECRGRRFSWADEYDAGRRAGDFPPACAGGRRGKRLGRVVQYDFALNRIRSWDGIREASEGTGIPYSSIYRAAVRGGSARGGMYHWRFEEGGGDVD